jgi:hypothetical protein
MSFERRGLPEAVWAPETTQLLEPGMQSGQDVRRRGAMEARMEASVGMGWLPLSSEAA